MAGQKKTSSSHQAKMEEELPDNLIDLEAVRERLQLVRCGKRVQTALEQNRQAIGRLFNTGLIFTRGGARAGRDLLLAHQHLDRMAETLLQAAGGTLSKNRSAQGMEELFAELDLLLEKTTALARRNGAFFQP